LHMHRTLELMVQSVSKRRLHLDRADPAFWWIKEKEDCATLDFTSKTNTPSPVFTKNQRQERDYQRLFNIQWSFSIIQPAFFYDDSVVLRNCVYVHRWYSETCEIKTPLGRAKSVLNSEVSSFHSAFCTEDSSLGPDEVSLCHRMSSFHRVAIHRFHFT
jgi:hypothetical protein